MLEKDLAKNQNLNDSNLIQLFNLSTDLMCTANLDGYFLDLSAAWEKNWVTQKKN